MEELALSIRAYCKHFATFFHGREIYYWEGYAYPLSPRVEPESKSNFARMSANNGDRVCGNCTKFLLSKATNRAGIKKIAAIF